MWCVYGKNVFDAVYHYTHGVCVQYRRREAATSDFDHVCAPPFCLVVQLQQRWRRPCTRNRRDYIIAYRRINGSGQNVTFRWNRNDRKTFEKNRLAVITFELPEKKVFFCLHRAFSRRTVDVLTTISIPRARSFMVFSHRRRVETTRRIRVWDVRGPVWRRNRGRAIAYSNKKKKNTNGSTSREKTWLNYWLMLDYAYV